jgi:Protein of unknown function (DUF1488)
MGSTSAPIEAPDANPDASMPLTAIDEPGEVDAFGVRFTMDDCGKRVRCHAFRSSINRMEDHAARNDEELLARFQKNRAMFEHMASALYDAGHRTPWIELLVVKG